MASIFSNPQSSNDQSIKPDHREPFSGKPKQWFLTASAAIKLIDSSSYGHREWAYESVASRLGVNAHTLRRAVAVMPLINNDLFSEVNLSEFPLDIVETLRKWAAKDPIGAKVAASNYDKSAVSVRKFRDLFSSETGAGKRQNLSIAAVREWRKAVNHYVGERFEKGSIIPSTKRLVENTIEIGELNSQSKGRIAVVAPYPVVRGEGAARRYLASLYQAIGMSIGYERVVVLLPKERLSMSINNSINGFNKLPNNVLIDYIHF